MAEVYSGLDLYPPLPSVGKAQHSFVEWSTRHHWARKALMANRSAQWSATGPDESRLKEEEPTLAWLNAESEHWMVYWRNVLHAQGVQAL